MVIITFKVLKEKLLSEEKTQTIRKNTRVKVGDSLYIWWGNPRFGNKPTDEVKRLGVGWTLNVEVKCGSELTEEDAIKDGFNNLEELMEALMTLNKMTREEVLGYEEWKIITWKWTEKLWKRWKNLNDFGGN